VPLRIYMTPQHRKTPSEDASDIRDINTKLDYIQSDVTEIKVNLKADYVTKDQLDPVKRLVYGTLALLATIAGLVIAQYISHGGAK
jgi:hypothetical protein